MIMKRLLYLLFILLPVISNGAGKQDFLSSLCENGKVRLRLNVEFDPRSSDDVPTDFGTAAHRGVTKNFSNDTAVLAIIENAMMEACSKVERAVIVPSGSSEDADAELTCRILSASSTVEETRGGASWGGVWASIKMDVTIADPESGQIFFSDTVTSEGRSHGGFNINLSSIEDAAGRMACFLGEDFRVIFPVSGKISAPYDDPKSSKTAFIVDLGSKDNVYSGGLATFRVAKVVEDGDSFKLVEIGSGYILDVLDRDKSVFRITYGSSAVKKAYEAGDTLIIRSR